MYWGTGRHGGQLAAGRLWLNAAVSQAHTNTGLYGQDQSYPKLPQTVHTEERESQTEANETGRRGIVSDNIEAIVGKEIPTKVAIGFLKYRVRDYIAPPTRCYKCLAFGHVAVHCQREQKCSICAGDHKYNECSKQTQKCTRCRGAHTVFDASCPAYMQAKQAAIKAAQTGQTYPQELKSVRKEAKASERVATGQGAGAVQDKAHAKETAAL